MHKPKNVFKGNPVSLYEPIDYILSLGGKQLRPTLVEMAYRLYRRNVDSIKPYAFAVELFHNFTLVHDDIMDQAPIRRGKKTVHEKWNVSTAILSGDVMLVKVYALFGQLPSDKLREVLPRFNQCAIEVCEGQQWDMEFENRSNVSLREYLKMIRLKTAVLLGFSLELGALLAGAPKTDQDVLRSCGIQLGLAFQLTDDYLDVYAPTKAFGKQKGGDILANKKTYLSLNAMEKSKGKDRKALNYWLKGTHNPSEKVAAITALYNTLGVDKMTKRAINRYYKKAFDDLDALKVNAVQKKKLKDYIAHLQHRLT